MKSDIRLPSNFLEYSGDPIVSNIDNEIKTEIEIEIKNKPLFSQYTAWNFNGLIWWHDELGYWAAEVWVFKKYTASYIAETLEELANEIDLEHGKDETAVFL
jgi:hypothetical protein